MRSRMRPPMRAVCPLALSVAMTFTLPGLVTSGLAHAEPDGLAALIADVAEANQRLEDIAAKVQAEQESVNKAILDADRT